MSAPGIPQNFYLQQGNQQVFVSWDLMAGATGYNVQRSADGITYASVAAPTTPSYLDTAVVIGTQYYYKVASVGVSGTSPYTEAQNIVPTPTAEMSLGGLRLAAQQRADRVNSNFVAVPEANSYINQSMYELYDLLIDVYEDYFAAPPLVFTFDGVASVFDLPNGSNYVRNNTPSPPFYKMLGLDLGLNSANNAYVTMNKFNFIDRNKFVYPNTASTIYGVFNLQYRMLGNQIKFIPTPSAGQPCQMWYIPRLKQLLRDNDITELGFSGWLEYVIVDVAIKILQKEESDVSVLMAQKMALKVRIEESANNRDAGRPDTISDVRQSGGSGFGWSGPVGGF